MVQDCFQLNQPTWRVMDQSHCNNGFDALDSFAMDDTLCASVGSKTSPPVARLWVHRKTVVLGIQDSRLPGTAAAMDYLKANGYQVIVRNSGGLAVALDPDVLNISLVLPIHNVFSGIDEGYETMRQLIVEMLQPYETTVVAGEIEGSYCPGRYDLSIGGRKFAGISQRRTKGGMAVQVFLLVSGSGRKRAEVIKQFYRLAVEAQPLQASHPFVKPETLASLSELLSRDVKVAALRQRLIDVLRQHSDQLVTTELSPDEAEAFRYNRQRMIERNEKSLYKLAKL